MALPVVPPTEFSYNGWTFGPYVNTRVTEEPITGDDRTVKYSKITINVTGWVTQADVAQGRQATGTVTVTGDLVTAVVVTNGGSGYTSVPRVTISPPPLEGALQATATATVNNGVVTAITVNFGGNGYSGATPTVTIDPPAFIGGTSLDATMQRMRLFLQRHGKPLKYVYKGYGIDLAVNVPGGTVRDVAMGPRAGTLEWRPLGGQNGANGATFSWSISTTIPECTSAIYRPGQNVFTEVSFTVEYATDEAGLVTVTTNGKAEIPLSLNDAGGLDGNIDGFITNILRPVPEGFLRRMTRQLSTDRRSCTFTITDRQIEIPYPDGVVEIDMQHRVKQEDAAGARWQNTISGTLRMAPGVAKSDAWARFFAITSNRIWFVAQQAAGAGGNAGVRIRNLINIPRVEITENLFKNSSSFSISWRLFQPRLFSTILLQSGLWQPVGTNFANWKTSLANNAQAPLGVLGTLFDPASEVIIDACGYNTAANNGGAPPNQVQGASPAQALAAMQNYPAQNAGISPANFFDPGDAGAGGDNPPGILLPPDGTQGEEQIDPDASWMEWRCTVRRITDHNVVRHKPLSGTITYDQVEPDPLGPVDPVAQDTEDPTFGVETSVPDIIQQTASPSVTLRLQGAAIRVAYRIKPPKLISFGGQPAVLDHEDVSETTLGQPNDLQLYRTDWDLIYIVPQPPGSVSVVANPADGSDGSQ